MITADPDAIPPDSYGAHAPHGPHSRPAAAGPRPPGERGPDPQLFADRRGGDAPLAVADRGGEIALLAEARPSTAGGVTRTTEASPIGSPATAAVVLRNFGEQIEETRSRTDDALNDSARYLPATLRL